MKFEFSNFELYVRIQNQNFELWYSIATCIKSIWHGKRYCYIISLNNWDVHDLFVHSWQTLNSPTIWSSPPLPSHYTWAYVCGHQGTWERLTIDLRRRWSPRPQGGYRVTQMQSTGSTSGRSVEPWTLQSECCGFGFNVQTRWSILCDSMTNWCCWYDVLPYCLRLRAGLV